MAVISAVVPVFLVALAGVGIRRRMYLDAKTLSSLNVYLFIPSLVFSSLSKQELEWSLFAKFAGATLLATALLIALLALLARRRGLEGSARSAFLMTSFPNLGNFGLPVARLAFGKEGLALAVVVMVCGSLLQNTIGLYLAQRGRHSAWGAFRSVFRFPVVYAFAFSLVFQETGWHLPAVIGNAIDIAGEGAIPVQLLVLGVKLAETRLDTGLDVLLASAVRLAVAPVCAFGVALLLGLEGLSRAVFVLQMSGPVAIGMAAYGVQFDVEPRFLASVVSCTFMLSLFTVSFLLYLFMPG